MWRAASFSCHCYKAVLLLTCFVLGVSNAYAIPGTDQSLTVTAVNTQLNRYAPVTAISGNTVTVTDITLLNRGAVGDFANNALSPGDLILLYQAQGAAFTDSTNATTYGAFNVQNAGRFEYAEVLYTTGNTIVLCGNVVNSYTISGRVQVVRVPQYTALTVNNGASVVPAGWNGTVGGIVALNVADTLTVNGQVNVDSQGFRGGARNTAGAIPGSTTYRTTDATLGAQKGESILGFGTEYTAANGQYGRGAPANGGGGGDAHNASGGGGANGNNAGTWNGQGSPDLSTSAWNCAWDLDDGTDDGQTNQNDCRQPARGVIPGYFTGGAGGGRGGYTYGASDQNAYTTVPGNTNWAGDNRRQVGGLGGRPLTNNPASNLFFGGGGGGGDNNDAGNTGTNGAPGGGLILVDANSLAGSGILSANGGTPTTPTTNAANDGSGGGGGGGTVVVRTGSPPSAGIVLRAAGGRGGNQVLATDESEGPGGGGGGGYIRVMGGATFTTAPSVTGGANGTSTSNAVTEFPPNGATRGYPGLYQAANFTFPGAQQCGLDFGDAPAPYPTLLANNGPRHLFPAAALRVSIGSLIDAETNGQPNATATLDDLTTSDDEDGVTFSTLRAAGPTSLPRSR